ncbi:hypothetical protein [Nesterenkonia populi]
MSQSLPSSNPAEAAVANAGRRGTGIIFAVMVTVLLVALIFAANENDIIGWILVAISAAWLLLAIVVVITFRRGARKFGDAVDSARADAAARNTEASGGTAVVDEDAHSRNLKLDHSFKIVQVQRRVVAAEIGKISRGEGADMEIVDRALETIQFTAHNGRDMLADVTGRRRSSDAAEGGQDGGGHDDQGTIEGDVVR